MTIKRICLFLAVATFILAGLVAAPTAEAKPASCSCDLCFAVPYYAICTIPWNGEVVGCLEFLIDYCPVGGPRETADRETVGTSQPEKGATADAAVESNRCESLVIEVQKDPISAKAP